MLNPRHAITAKKEWWDICPPEKKDTETKKDHRIKADKDTVLAIRKNYSEGARIVDLIEEYGLTDSIVFKIVHRKTWKHI